MTSPAANTRDRILGCLLGGAIGDALGHSFEGSGPIEVVTDTRLWSLSDDTQLTLATCEGIIEAGGRIDPEVIAGRFAAWHRAQRVTGMGSSTLKALAELVQGGHWALVGRRGEMAAGNGAAMRSAPLAFFLNVDDAEDPFTRRTLRDVCRITHHNDEAYAGALAIVSAVRAAWTGAWTGDATLLRLVKDRLPDTNVRDRIQEMAQVERDLSLRELAARFGCSGWVVETVPLALCAAQRVRSLGFEAMLRELVGAGGDADTLASMAGQVAGTLLGPSGLPAAWLARLPERALIEQTAAALARWVLS
ncbi:MAG TPA: ADP-ribosylglycohydrolase family protein [Haliangium sp.]|nr:ADP-ribosylglycohydrolase family protein [Haliangium sp.]